ncbi:auxin response factor 1 [Perilla frutescens var. hirtella]|nr:auxin response factor 1 [Perilla frutescens var. hirtella]
MEELNFGEEGLRSLDRRPSFYKLIWLDNLIDLRIPPDFVHDHLAGEEIDGVILKGPCGSWDVKLEQRDDGLFIVQGWQDFVRGHCLGDNELAQFLYNGGMSFDVKIFAKDGWLKDYQTSPKECTPSFTSSFPFFKHEMKGYNVGHKCIMQIPKAFSSEHHLPMSKQKMELRDSDGVSWSVSIIVMSSGHLALSGGWKLFTDAHSIKKGDVCIFELVEEKLMQFEASTHQGLDQQLPSFNLPSKILRKVMNVQLRAEADTDEVYAQITLLPEQDLLKVRTSLHIFGRGENGELRVGVRRLMRQPNNMPSSVISSHSMHLENHPIKLQSFVFRTSRSEFIVSVNKYLEAQNHKLSVGMRFKMRFEGEEVPERRSSRQIIMLVGFIQCCNEVKSGKAVSDAAVGIEEQSSTVGSGY